jgi:hypothetical protein
LRFPTGRDDITSCPALPPRIWRLKVASPHSMRTPMGRPEKRCSIGLLKPLLERPHDQRIRGRGVARDAMPGRLNAIRNRRASNRLEWFSPLDVNSSHPSQFFGSHSGYSRLQLELGIAMSKATHQPHHAGQSIWPDNTTRFGAHQWWPRAQQALSP